MTPEQFTGLLVALTGLIAAIGVLITQVRSYHHAVDGRMTELLEVTKTAAFARGRVPQVGDFPTGDSDSAPHTETHGGGSI